MFVIVQLIFFFFFFFFDKSKMLTIDYTAVTVCSCCKKTIIGEFISIPKKRCVDRPVKCPECSEIVAFQKWCEHECQEVEAKGNYFCLKIPFFYISKSFFVINSTISSSTFINCRKKKKFWYWINV